MRNLSFASLALFAGCVVVEPIGPAEPPVEEGTCPPLEDVEAAADLVHEVLDLGEAWPAGPLVAESFQDEASFDSFLEAHGLSAPEIDFATEQVLVAGVQISSTCTGGESEWRVVDLDGVAHLDLSVFDDTSGCETVCDMASVHWVAVTVPAGTPATACARFTETCES